jgi:di/tricarboxylate transporter
MTPEAIITLIIIAGAIFLFVTEWLSIDLVAMLILVTLVVSGVITPREGVEGFSNNATITVAFMFVLSAALLKSGALQFVTYRLTALFRKNFMLGMLLMMVFVGLISAFINNTPVVAVFIPVIMQIARSIGVSPSKMLIPLSFATIFGGTVTLIGTSTNILVNGIVEKAGLESLSMFDMTPMGLVFMMVGIGYMMVIGIRLLPDRGKEKDLTKKFSMRNYLAEIEVPAGSTFVNRKILEAAILKEMEVDILEVKRDDDRFLVPPGDFILQAGDVLKVRCDVEKMRMLKDRALVLQQTQFKIGNNNLKESNSVLVELMLAPDSQYEGATLREIDFRNRFRGVPLAIQHREEIVHEHIYDVPLRVGDIILAEVKKHYVAELNRNDQEQGTDFILLSEDEVLDFNKKQFWITIGIVMAVIILATTNVLDIMTGSIAATCLLVLLRFINMKEVYEAINWNVVFLLAGALSLGTAMKSSGLDTLIASQLTTQLGDFGPVIILSGLYLVTSLLTEIMSNNATAALLAPIAITTADQMGVSYLPFIMAITFAASATFSTPVGYQCNTMVYSAGQYRFVDFTKVGIWINIMFWLLATLLIPIFYPF